MCSSDLAIAQVQTGQFQNDGAATATSYLPTTAITDAVVTTKALDALAAAQTFKIAKNSLLIFENATATPATIKTTNIQTTNGIIHLVSRVLVPVL